MAKSLLLMSGCACCMLPATGCCCRLPVAVAVVATVADISFLFFWPQPTEAKRSCGAPRATHNLAPNWQIVFTTNCSPLLFPYTSLPSAHPCAVSMPNRGALPKHKAKRNVSKSWTKITPRCCCCCCCPLRWPCKTKLQPVVAFVVAFVVAAWQAPILFCMLFIFNGAKSLPWDAVADTTQTQQNPWLCLLKMQRCNHLGHSQAAPNPIRVIDNPR